MTTSLRSLMSELAGDAGVYGDPALAVRTAKRRSLVRSGVSALAAVAVLVTGAWLVPGIRMSPVPEPPDPLYPPTVSSATGAPPLPSDRPVGPASMVYVTCPSCGPRLVLPDGGQYALPAGTGLRGYTLSPDGRWLGSIDGDGYQLRDLTGTAVRRLTGPGGWRDALWSPNGRWLVLTWSRPNQFVLVDLLGGDTRITAELGDSGVYGVLDTGGWLVAGGSGPDPTFADYDPGTGKTTPRQIAPVAGTGEFATNPVLLACSCAVMLGVYRSTQAGPVALVRVDLGDGHIVARRVLSDGADLRLLAGQPGGLMLLRLGDRSAELVRLDDVTAGLRVVSRLPADSRVVVRGGAGN